MMIIVKQQGIKYLNARISLEKGMLDFYVSDSDEERDFIVTVKARGMKLLAYRIQRGLEGVHKEVERVDVLEGYEDEIHRICFDVDNNRNYIIEIYNSSYPVRYRCYFDREEGSRFFDGLRSVACFDFVFCWGKCRVEAIQNEE